MGKSFRLELHAAVALTAWTLGCRGSEPPVRADEPKVSQPSAAEPANAHASADSARPMLPDAAASNGSRGLEPSTELPPIEERLVSDLKPGERLPLVVFLHGLGASAKTAFDALPLARLGASSRVHVIAADGTRDSKGRLFWNAGPSCCNFDHQEVDDVARLGALVARWAERPEIDAERIYLMGVSNGAFMALRLACERSEHLAAVAAFSGALEKRGDCPGLSRIGVLMLHGDADEIVHYGAGRVFDDPRLAEHLSAPEGFREWGRRLRCAGEPKPAQALDLDPKLPGTETSPEHFERCPGGDSALFTVLGGSHYVASRSGIFETAWNYLLKHRKR